MEMSSCPNVGPPLHLVQTLLILQALTSIFFPLGAHAVISKPTLHPQILWNTQPSNRPSGEDVSPTPKTHSLRREYYGVSFDEEDVTCLLAQI